VWDVVAQQWRISAGSYQVYVGKNVLDEEMLTGSFELVPERLQNVGPLVPIAAGVGAEQIPM
jgi:hypothetical protein